MEELLKEQNALLKKQLDKLGSINTILTFYFILTLLGFLLGGCSVLMSL
jgi:hypothetical protein